MIGKFDLLVYAFLFEEKIRLKYIFSEQIDELVEELVIRQRYLSYLSTIYYLSSTISLQLYDPPVEGDVGIGGSVDGNCEACFTVARL